MTKLNLLESKVNQQLANKVRSRNEEGEKFNFQDSCFNLIRNFQGRYWLKLLQVLCLEGNVQCRKCLNNKIIYRNNSTRSNNVVRMQNVARMQSEGSRNVIRMSPECNQNVARTQPVCSQNVARIQSECSQNVVRIQSECSQNAVRMQ